MKHDYRYVIDDLGWWRKLKSVCATEGVTIRSLITRLLNEWMNNQKGDSK